MPNELKKIPPAAEPTIGGEPSGNPPAPQYATKDDLTVLSNTVTAATQRLEQTIGRFDAAAASRETAPPPAAPQEPVRTITQEHIDAAYDESDYKKASSLQNKYNAESLAILDFHTNQKIQQATNTGASMIASQAMKAAGSDPDMPYFTRFRKEVDEVLRSVDAAGRGDSNVIRAVYDSVVGKHYSELMNEEREKFAREAANDGGGGGVAPGSGGPARGQGNDGGGGKLTIDGVFGLEAPQVHARLREVAGGLTGFLQKRGYKDEQEWLQAQKQHREEEVKV